MKITSTTANFEPKLVPKNNYKKSKKARDENFETLGNFYTA
jgi:hypothetical protein